MLKGFILGLIIGLMMGVSMSDQIMEMAHQIVTKTRVNN